jgi:hypothetical protein
VFGTVTLTSGLDMVCPAAQMEQVELLLLLLLLVVETTVVVF